MANSGVAGAIVQVKGFAYVRKKVQYRSGQRLGNPSTTTSTTSLCPADPEQSPRPVWPSRSRPRPNTVRLSSSVRTRSASYRCASGSRFCSGPSRAESRGAAEARTFARGDAPDRIHRGARSHLEGNGSESRVRLQVDRGGNGRVAMGIATSPTVLRQRAEQL
jgi:hypothetical protein